MTEQWRDIPDIDGYQSSNLGNIRSLTRQVRCQRGFRTVRGMQLKAFISRGTGYFQVAICKKRYSVHRLIALTWCRGHFAGAVVDHINGNRTDNRAENLRWVSSSENARHGYELGRANPCLGKLSSDHPTSRAVISTCMNTGAERRYDAAMDAVREGFDSSSISRCCSGENAYHKGRYWRFADHETRKGGWLPDAQGRAA